MSDNLILHIVSPLSSQRSASLKKLPKPGRIPQNLGYLIWKEEKVTRRGTD